MGGLGISARFQPKAEIELDWGFQPLAESTADISSLQPLAEDEARAAFHWTKGPIEKCSCMSIKLNKCY